MKRDSQPRTKRTWAALVYIAGDNDLSERGLSDLQEICDAGACTPDDGEGVNSVYVGVEIDTKGEHDGSIRYEITDDGYRTVIERLPERNTGDPESLIDFLRWGFRRFPAEKYLAVVWGHGEGFKLRRGVAFDDTGGSLDIPGVASALQALGASPKSGFKVDVLGFDACLMSMIEIAYRLRHHVRVLVGSQQTEPGDGWPYQPVLQALRLCRDERDMGRRIVDLYYQNYKRRLISNATQSAINLDGDWIENVVRALGVLGERLAALSGRHGDAILAARTEAQGFDGAADYVDLLHLCGLLKVRLPKVRAEVEEVERAADNPNTILANQAFGPAVVNARGLSVWFPGKAVVYERYRSAYRSLAAELCPRCDAKSGDPQNDTHVPWVVPGERCPGCGERFPPLAGDRRLLGWLDFLDRIQRGAPVTSADSGIAVVPPQPKTDIRRGRRATRS